jgi:hypothetical protein
MKPNLDKIDAAVLALLHLTHLAEPTGGLTFTRAWKGHDWDPLGRLHAKGLVGDPVGKAKSVGSANTATRGASSGSRSCFVIRTVPR